MNKLVIFLMGFGFFTFVIFSMISTISFIGWVEDIIKLSTLNETGSIHTLRIIGAIIPPLGGAVGFL